MTSLYSSHHIKLRQTCKNLFVLEYCLATELAAPISCKHLLALNSVLRKQNVLFYAKINKIEENLTYIKPKKVFARNWSSQLRSWLHSWSKLPQPSNLILKTAKPS